MNLLACATCVAAAASETNNAGGYSILFMLGVILAMLAGVCFFMVRMIRRGDSMLDPELSDQPSAAAALPTR